MFTIDKLSNISLGKNSVFEIVKQAKDAENKHGKAAVITSTLGTFYDDDGKFHTFNVIEETYKGLESNDLFNYAADIGGSSEYREAVKNNIFGKEIENFKNSYISVTATTGGTGALYSAFKAYANQNDTILLPNFMWESYMGIAKSNDLNVAKYNLFKDGKFDIENFKDSVLEIVKKQKKILLVINDPCQNPTGYSLSDREWTEIMKVLVEAEKYGKVILINDIAYIDYDFRGYDESRKYLRHFSNLPENILVIITFSISKSFTSYGLRVGAEMAISSKKEVIEEFEKTSSFICRTTWSNISRGGMALFSKICQNKELLDRINEERNKAIEILKNRSGIFIEKSKNVGLDFLPYSGGFFITIPLNKNILDEVIDDLKTKNVFVLPLKEGIGIAICSIPANKLEKLPGLIKDSIEKFKNN